LSADGVSNTLENILVRKRMKLALLKVTFDLTET